MSFLPSPTPEEVERALQLSLEALRLRSYYRPSASDTATRTFAQHVVERMRKAGRSQIALTYQECDHYIVDAHRMPVAGPAVPGIEYLIQALIDLDRAGLRSSLASPERVPLTLPDDNALHWVEAPDCIPGHTLTEYTTIHFVVDPVHTEVCYGGIQARLFLAMTQKNQEGSADMPAAPAAAQLPEASPRVQELSAEPLAAVTMAIMCPDDSEEDEA